MPEVSRLIKYRRHFLWLVCLLFSTKVDVQNLGVSLFFAELRGAFGFEYSVLALQCFVYMYHHDRSNSQWNESLGRAPYLKLSMSALTVMRFSITAQKSARAPKLRSAPVPPLPAGRYYPSDQLLCDNVYRRVVTLWWCGVYSTIDSKPGVLPETQANWFSRQLFATDQWTERHMDKSKSV